MSSTVFVAETQSVDNKPHIGIYRLVTFHNELNKISAESQIETICTIVKVKIDLNTVVKALESITS